MTTPEQTLVDLVRRPALVGGPAAEIAAATALAADVDCVTVEFLAAEKRAAGPLRSFCNAFTQSA